MYKYLVFKSYYSSPIAIKLDMIPHKNQNLPLSAKVKTGMTDKYILCNSWLFSPSFVILQWCSACNCQSSWQHKLELLYISHSAPLSAVHISLIFLPFSLLTDNCGLLCDIVYLCQHPKKKKMIYDLSSVRWENIVISFWH